jgi:hypothetical protein
MPARERVAHPGDGLVEAFLIGRGDGEVGAVLELAVAAAISCSLLEGAPVRGIRADPSAPRFARSDSLPRHTFFSSRMRLSAFPSGHRDDDREDVRDRFAVCGWRANTTGRGTRRVSPTVATRAPTSSCARRSR